MSKFNGKKKCYSSIWPLRLIATILGSVRELQLRQHITNNALGCNFIGFLSRNWPTLPTALQNIASTLREPCDRHWVSRYDSVTYPRQRYREWSCEERWSSYYSVLSVWICLRFCGFWLANAAISIYYFLGFVLLLLSCQWVDMQWLIGSSSLCVEINYGGRWNRVCACTWRQLTWFTGICWSEY